MLSSSKAKLTTLLSIASLPKSTYYYKLKRLNILVEKDKEIYERINSIFNKHKERYGVRRIYHQLRNEGYVINHKKVQRIMKKLGLKGIRPKEKYHSYKGDVSPFAKNIIDRNFKTDKPNKKWSTDITQFNCQCGKCYLSPIIDMFVGDIVSYDLSMSPNMKQTMNMLNTAITKYDDLKGLILHSDQGWQYQQKIYQSTLKKHGIIQSMSRKGNCYDNCIIETFFGKMKNEMFYGFENKYSSFEEFKVAVDEFIEYYNNERIKAKSNWLPPSRYRDSFRT